MVKTKRALTKLSDCYVVCPLEYLYTDALESMQTISVCKRSHALSIFESFIAYLSIHIYFTWTQVFEAVQKFMCRAKRWTGRRLYSIRLDSTGKHKGDIAEVLQWKECVTIDLSPAYASQSDGTSKRLMQYTSTRARVMLNNTGLPNLTSVEAMHHGNWLQNRPPLKSIHHNLPVRL